MQRAGEPLVAGDAPRRGGPGERAEYVEAVGKNIKSDSYAGFANDAIDYIEGVINKDQFDERVRTGQQTANQGSAGDWRIEFPWPETGK